MAAQSISESVSQSSRFPAMPSATLHHLSPPALFDIDHMDVFQHWHMLGCHLVSGVRSAAPSCGGSNPIVYRKTQRSGAAGVQSERFKSRGRKAIQETFEGDVVTGGRRQAGCPDYLTNCRICWNVAARPALAFCREQVPERGKYPVSSNTLSPKFLPDARGEPPVIESALCSSCNGTWSGDSCLISFQRNTSMNTIMSKWAEISDCW